MEKKNEKNVVEQAFEDCRDKGEEVVNENRDFFEEAKKWGIIIGCIVLGIGLGVGGAALCNKAEEKDGYEDEDYEAK